MNFRSRRGDEVHPDLTPLIDVVFLLLLFFMLTTTFVHSNRLKLDLPEAASGESVREREPWVIEVDAQGRYALNGDVVDAAMLAARLKAMPEDASAAGLLVRADGQASHQAVVRVLDAARAAGITRIGIATEGGGSEVHAPR